jgi:membrane associated rhomboid family serine protease
VSEKPSPDRYAGFTLLAAIVALMWLVEVVDSLDKHRLDQYGIEPRDVDHFDGVVFAPFLHVSFAHLLANTVPFVVLGAVIAFEGLGRLAGVTVIVALVSGVGTWLVGPANTVHVGASGVVFGYATYLIARGWFNHRVGEIVIGVALAVLWGSVLLAGLQPHEGISWQGHLFGAVGGVVAAAMLARPKETPAAVP